MGEKTLASFKQSGNNVMKTFKTEDPSKAGQIYLRTFN